MIVRWNDVLGLPGVALAGDRIIPKAQLVRQGGLTKTQQRKLKGVERLSHFATLQKSTTRMPPVRDSEHDIQAVIVLACELRGTTAPSEVSEIVHGAFPNPTVLLLDDGVRIGISVVSKRLSRSERGAVADERSSYSAMFDEADERFSGYLEAVAYDELDQSTLLAYLESLMDATDLARVVPTLGRYPHCARSDVPRLLALARELDVVQHQIAELDARRKDKGTPLSESARLRVQMRERSRERDRMVAAIGDLCL